MNFKVRIKKYKELPDSEGWNKGFFDNYGGNIYSAMSVKNDKHRLLFTNERGSNIEVSRQCCDIILDMEF